MLVSVQLHLWRVTAPMGTKGTPQENLIPSFSPWGKWSINFLQPIWLKQHGQTLINKGYTRNMFTFILFYVIIFLVVGVKHTIQVTFGLQRCYLTPKEKSGPQPPAWHKLYSGGNILTASWDICPASHQPINPSDSFVVAEWKLISALTPPFKLHQPWRQLAKSEIFNVG